MGNECNITYQLTNVRRQMHPDQLAGRQNQPTHTDKNKARELHVATCTQHQKAEAMREPLAEEVPGPPGNVVIGPGTGSRSLRKICTAKDAVSGRHARVCKGWEAAHRLLEDADVEVRAVRVQGVWCPPVAGLTVCRAHLAAAGAVKLGQSWCEGRYPT